MRHYGDICKMSGYEIEGVELVIGGSPCQDLSVAGKRAGLAGERSGLFMEQIRVIKEMRNRNSENAKNGLHPRFMLWENVCFDGNTFVTCEDGYKNISDVRVGDKVKTISGNYYPVCKVHQTKKCDVIKVAFSGGEDLVVTPNHPFYVREKTYTDPKKHRGKVYEPPKWIPACQLTANSLVAHRIDVPTLPDDFISEAEAWTVGRWLADGSVDLKHCNPRMFISCGLKKLEEARLHLYKLPYDVHENHPHPTAVNFCFTSAEFYALIANAGVGAGNKQVPPYVFQLPFSLQKQVLDGYISGDGHYRWRKGHDEVSAITASRKLAYGIARLIRNVYRVGSNISVRWCKGGCINGRKLNVNYPSYSITASYTHSQPRYFVDDEFIWQPVKSIEDVHEKRTVYNLSVLEDNTYGANDVMVHNCGAFSSNNGEDFRAVLEETARIAEPTVSIPRYEGGRWTNAGTIIGDHWSIAWRTHDAQFFGTPQRRKRIAVLADFNGLLAPEILFERNSGGEPGSEVRSLPEGLSRDSEESGSEGEDREDAGDSGKGSGISSGSYTFRNHFDGRIVRENSICLDACGGGNRQPMLFRVGK